MAEKQAMPVQKEAAPPTEVMRRPFLSLRDEIDRVFDEFMSWSPFRGGLFERPLTRFAATRSLEPAADVVERDDAYEIDVDVPGLKKDNIEIAVSDNNLMVRCDLEEEKEEKGREYYCRERHHESFARAFEIPPGVNADQIAADLDNGVLKIILPKTPEAQQKKTREIDINPH